MDLGREKALRSIAHATTNGGSKKRKLPQATAALVAESDWDMNPHKRKYKKNEQFRPGWNKYSKNDTASAQSSMASQGNNSNNNNNNNNNNNKKKHASDDNSKNHKDESESIPEDVWLDNPKNDEYRLEENMFLVENMKPNQKKKLRVMPLPHEAPYTIIGEGSKTAVLGKSWIVLKIHQRVKSDHGNDPPKYYVDCATTVVDWIGKKIRRLLLIRVNNAIHYPNRYESFLPIHLVTQKGHKVDSELLFRGGQQHVHLIGGETIDLFTDGERTFFRTFEPSKKDTKKLPRFQLTNRLLETFSEENAKTSEDDTKTREHKAKNSEDNSKSIFFLEEQVKIQEVTLRAWRQRREEILVEKEAALAKKRELIDQRSNLIERQTTLESARTKHFVLQAELKESLAMSREKLKRLTMLENEEKKEKGNKETDDDTDGFLEISETIREPSKTLLEIETPEGDLEVQSNLRDIPAKRDAAVDANPQDANSQISQFPLVFDSYQNVRELARYHNDTDARNHRSLSGFLPYLDSTRVGDYLTLMLRETYALDRTENGGMERSLRRQLFQNTCLDVILLAPSKSGENEFAVGAYSDATAPFFDPNISLCPYELAGVCADDVCPYQHTRKPTKILARERLLLPSLPFSFLSEQPINAKAGENIKAGIVKTNIVMKRADSGSEDQQHQNNSPPVNEEMNIANDGDNIGEGEDFIMLPPSSSPSEDNENDHTHHETADSDDENKTGDEEAFMLLSPSISKNIDNVSEKYNKSHEIASDGDCNNLTDELNSTSFWWGGKSPTYQGEGTEEMLRKDTRTSKISILNIFEDTFGLAIREYPERSNEGSSASTEKRLEIKGMISSDRKASSGNKIVEDLSVLGRLVDASRLALHGGLHGVSITATEYVRKNFLKNGSLQGFAYLLRVQIEMSRFFDQFSPLLSCFEDAFATQTSLAILSWSLAEYSKTAEKCEGKEALVAVDLETACRICIDTLRNPDASIGCDMLDTLPLEYYLTNDYFEAQETDPNDIEDSTINVATRKINGLRSFISWARRYLIPRSEDRHEEADRPLEEQLDAVWLTAKKFLKENAEENKEGENGGDSSDKDFRCIKVIIVVGYAIFGCLSKSALGAISPRTSESNEGSEGMTGSKLSASKLAAWTLLDGAIARMLKDMKRAIVGFPFLHVLLAPLFSCSIASAAYLRNYSTAQSRLVDCLTAKGQPPANLMVYSELLWSQLVQLRMCLPNESPAMVSPSIVGNNLIQKGNKLLAKRDAFDDFAWEPSKTLTEENQKFIAKLGSLDIRLRHVVLWGDWMLSSLIEKKGSSETLLGFISNNRDGSGLDHNSEEMSSISIGWRDNLEKLYGKTRKGKRVYDYKLDQKYFGNRCYPPPTPLSRLPLFLLHAGKFLVDLSLQGCALEKLPLAFGLYFPNLRNLDISNNDLEELPESFRKLTERMEFLEIFRASHNKLESLPSDTLSASSKQSSSPPSLKILNLSHNQLVSVPSLVGLDNLEILALQHNSLVDMSVADWSRLALRLPSLRILNRESQGETDWNMEN